jgi:O-antigen/teichoic acid export membrane protein
MKLQWEEGWVARAESKRRMPMTHIQEFLRDLKTSLYKNAAYLTANIVIGSGLGFFFWMVVARIYSPHEVGLAGTIIPISVLIGLLSRFGLEIGLVRFLPSSGQASSAMINSCLTISVIAAASISTLFLMGLDIWSPALSFIRQDWAFSLSFIVFSVVFALYPMINQVFVALRDTKYILAGTSISGLRMILPVILAFFGSYGIFASWSIAMLIALAVGTFIFIPAANPGYKPFPTVSRNLVSKMFRFSSANYVAGIFGALPAALLPLVIVNSLGPEDVAYYYIAFTIANLLFLITGAVCMSLFAEGSYRETELAIHMRKALRLVFVLLIPAIIVILLFGGSLLLLFGNDYSQQGLILLQVFAISSVFVAINGIYYASRQVLKKLGQIIAIPAFSALAIIGFGYLFLLSFGLVGVAIGWTLSQGIVTTAIGVYVIKRRIVERI